MTNNPTLPMLMAMRLPLQRIVLAALFAATPVFAQPRECSVAGTKIHWIADYCMSKLETDDEIAASSCINVAAARVFTNDCVAKRYYKKAMCELAIARKQRPHDINSCLADKEFTGSTVRNGGVGGGS